MVIAESDIKRYTIINLNYFRTITRFIARICEIYAFSTQNLKYLGLYDNT